MHQDQRIGLALGVLLIGACAAFFFRNETREISNAPRLHNARELDDRIAERSTRPYMNGIEAVEAADRNRMRTVVDRGPAADGLHDENGTSYWSPVESFNGKFTRENSHKNRKPRARLTDTESDIQELAPIPVPSNNNLSFDRARDNEPQANRAGNERAARNPESASTEGRTHVVQKGETLSSIAAKRLGSANRFHEIFDANQDQLKDANDLKMGMTLRIPETRVESAVKPSTTSKARPAGDVESPIAEQATLAPVDPLNEAAPPSFEVQSLTPSSNIHEPTSILMPPELPNEPRLENPVESPPTDEMVPARKFVPARRLPPPTRPVTPQAKNDRSPNAAGRKLSQASLESTSGKVAR